MMMSDAIVVIACDVCMPRAPRRLTLTARAMPRPRRNRAVSKREWRLRRCCANSLGSGKRNRSSPSPACGRGLG
ncbi:hypothetical protein [Lysobacter gummosus]|uniref:hypothetical protein n=1 Tax=Lysobacter gummosus TaxID=262324 RepID=UPI0036363187